MGNAEVLHDRRQKAIPALSCSKSGTGKYTISRSMQSVFQNELDRNLWMLSIEAPCLAPDKNGKLSQICSPNGFGIADSSTCHSACPVSHLKPISKQPYLLPNEGSACHHKVQQLPQAFRALLAPSMLIWHPQKLEAAPCWCHPSQMTLCLLNRQESSCSTLEAMWPMFTWSLERESAMGHTGM